MKKVVCLLAVLVILATSGCSLKNDAYKSKTAQEFIETMEEIKEEIPEDCEFDYEVGNTLMGKARATMSMKYNGHEVKMIFTFDNWDSIDELDLDEQEAIDEGILAIRIDGKAYDYEAADALMDVYFGY